MHRGTIFLFLKQSPLDILLFPLWALTFVSATLLPLIFLPVISSWHIYPLPSVRLTPWPLIIFTPWQRDTGVAIETRSSAVKVTVSVVCVWVCVCWDGSRVSLLVSMSEALWARWDIGAEISAGSEVNGNGTRGHVLYTQTQKQTGIYRNTTSCTKDMLAQKWQDHPSSVSFILPSSQSSLTQCTLYCLLLPCHWVCCFRMLFIWVTILRNDYLPFLFPGIPQKLQTTKCKSNKRFFFFFFLISCCLLFFIYIFDIIICLFVISILVWCAHTALDATQAKFFHQKITVCC